VFIGISPGIHTPNINFPLGFPTVNQQGTLFTNAPSDNFSSVKFVNTHTFFLCIHIDQGNYKIVCAVHNQTLVGSDGVGFYINGTVTASNRFTVKGIGYSPTPVGKFPTDYYTQPSQYLYRHDIPTIAATGANTVRMASYSLYSPFPCCEIQFLINRFYYFFSDSLVGMGL
jgi:hypothetical protein